MSDQERLERLLEANSRVIDLAISEEQRPGVLAYLSLAESMYRLLSRVELGPVDESGLVFVPQTPARSDE